MQLFRYFITGMVIGLANIIPGVSGGTMAVVFNVYDRLINLIRFNLKQILADWRFVLVLGAGMLTGIFLFARLLSILLVRHPVPVGWFFIGIIAGSIPLIARRASFSVRRPSSAFFALLGLAVMVLSFLFGSHEGAAAAVSAVTPLNLAWMFAMGAVAAIAMIIPGISGSLILVVLGAYPTVIGAVSERNLPFLGAIAAGVLAGLFGSSGLIRALLQRAPRATYAVILGLVAGSLLTVWPGPARPLSILVFSVPALAAGLAVSILFSRSEVSSAGTEQGETVQ